MSSVKPPPCVGMALGITSQEWTSLGMGDDPAVAASPDLNANVERITALLLIRIVAWLQPQKTFPDLSTTTICRQILINPGSWPSSISPEVMSQLEAYVKVILLGYRDNPYHNFEHCYHVTASAHKLLDMMLHVEPTEKSKVFTFGLRDDPLMHFALVFAALIHDVEHRGVPNRQLEKEDDVLAIQYNDTSVAEHRSLYIGFSELLKPEYATLRSVVFPVKQDYTRFRGAVINLVLTTDIASPERAQIGKSKWKEAFGDPYETVERKVIKLVERRASMASKSAMSRSQRQRRRMSTQSIMSELTLDEVVPSLPVEVASDDSLSETPESSDNEDYNAPIKSDAGVAGKPNGGPIYRPPPRSKSANVHETLRTPTTRRSRKALNAKDDGASQSSGDLSLAGMALKFQRRLSSIGPASTATGKRRATRLGLLRTVDLTGEELETYAQNHRTSATGATTDDTGPVATPEGAPEEMDELRETVVLETFMKAADVAHNLQGWDLMAKYSNRLFLELKRAYAEGRGEDPQGGWFSNQIGFLEAYLLPLARKLDDTGVFGDTRGSVFALIVEENKERWLREGMALTARIILKGHQQYPEAESDEEQLC